MEAYRQSLKKRILLLSIGGGIALIVVIVVILNLFEPSTGDLHYNSFISGFQVGLTGSVTVACFAQAFRYYKISKDEEKLKIEKIKEEDERLQFIDAKTGGQPILWCAYVFIITGTISAYFNKYVFATLIVCAVFLAIMKIALHTYYSKKY
ncbi:hypothetical protein [Breznakia pachnodae]|uniref:Uncharacterized protein YhhL (DUF1145 family) n=1 Tax=Breznakia pachnodae TaxID=265178 RepID=A0ABU0DY46_9FIRM|nr:hypothetical protein [Breznakia pachnodae]MDQ0359475.1 uncharacterized protein YhhL (DUF1145 family) [Breznakia pachnodae]